MGTCITELKILVQWMCVCQCIRMCWYEDVLGCVCVELGGGEVGVEIRFGLCGIEDHLAPLPCLFSLRNDHIFFKLLGGLEF